MEYLLVIIFAVSSNSTGGISTASIQQKFESNHECTFVGSKISKDLERDNDNIISNRCYTITKTKGN